MSTALPEPANPSHALATTIADELARLGLEEACLSPGSRSAALALALAADDRIRVHVGIDERSTAFLALGLARASHHPVALVSTSGTAPASFHPAVIEADASRVPLLVLTADRPAELRHTGANQTVDQVGLYGGAVRWSVDLPAPVDRPDANGFWRSTACRAWAEASGAGGPAGPVHLNLSFREPLVPAEVDARGTTDGPFTSSIAGRAEGRPWTTVGPEPRRAASWEADAIAERIAGTERGLLVAGDTTAVPGPIVALARAAAWPLLAEPLSGARHGPHAIAAYDLLLGVDRFAGGHRPDLVLRIGRTALSRHLLEQLDADVPQILVDRDAAWLDPGRAVRRVVAADPADLCARLADELPERQPGAWLDGWRDADRRARAAVDTILDADDHPSEPRAARDLAAGLPDGTALIAGSSMPVRDLDRFMAPRDGLRVVGNRGASGIDGAVSLALGIALGHDGPTVALIGDLALLHDMNGLLVRRRPDLVVVVVNNDGGGIFSLLPQAEFTGDFEHLFGTPHGVDLGALAAAHGAAHHLVDRASDLVPTVDRATEDGGVAIVEIRTDRTDNAALHRRLRTAVSEALAG